MNVRAIPLAGWEFVETVASSPAQITAAAWSPATVPGTVASSLREAGRWSLDSTPRRFDAEEWWYRTRFSADPPAADERVYLVFDGLATLAEVWLNGKQLLTSANMFLAHRCDVSALLSTDNQLYIRFAPLDAFLAARRRRPRWRTPMVEHQQLRWVRTTLLGRTPGWSPPAAPVGPWRPGHPAAPASCRTARAVAENPTDRHPGASVVRVFFDGPRAGPRCGLPRSSWSGGAIVRKCH